MVNLVHNISTRFRKPVAHRFPELAPADPELEEDDTLFELDDIEPEDEPEVCDSALLAAVLAQTSDVKSRPPVKPEADVKPEPDVQPMTGWCLPGFEGKCRVSTSFGDLPIEALRRRDQVKTISGAYREVQWVDAIRLDEDFLQRHKDALPVMVRARTLGGGFPAQNMLISPAQEIWTADPSAGFRSNTARSLLERPGFMRQLLSGVTYYRFHCGTPEKICIEGSYFCVSPPA